MRPLLRVPRQHSIVTFFYLMRPKLFASGQAGKWREKREGLLADAMLHSCIPNKRDCNGALQLYNLYSSCKQRLAASGKRPQISTVKVRALLGQDNPFQIKVTPSLPSAFDKSNRKIPTIFAISANWYIVGLLVHIYIIFLSTQKFNVEGRASNLDIDWSDLKRIELVNLFLDDDSVMMATLMGFTLCRSGSKNCSSRDVCKTSQPWPW